MVLVGLAAGRQPWGLGSAEALAWAQGVLSLRDVSLQTFSMHVLGFCAAC